MFVRPGPEFSRCPEFIGCPEMVFGSIDLVNHIGHIVDIMGDGQVILDVTNR